MIVKFCRNPSCDDEEKLENKSYQVAKKKWKEREADVKSINNLQWWIHCDVILCNNISVWQIISSSCKIFTGDFVTAKEF